MNLLNNKMEHEETLKLISKYYNEGKIKEAREHCQELANKGNTEAIATLGMIYETEGDFSKAKELYDKAKEMDYYQALPKLADMYRRGKGMEQNREKAIEYYQEAISNGSNYARVELGEMYLEEGKDEEARELFEMAVKTEQKALFAHFNLIKIYRNRKDYEKMIKNGIPLINESAGWYTQVVHELCLVDKYVLTGKMLKLLNEKDELIEKLQNENKNLSNEILELTYKPGGPGYHEAKDRFEREQCKAI